MNAPQSQPIQHPAGAMVRVSDICRHPKTGQPGLLPIARSTWYKWIEDGRVPAGRKLGTRTTVWPIEQVMAVGQVEQ